LGPHLLKDLPLASGEAFTGVAGEQSSASGGRELPRRVEA
jgi:hypothetical protein